MTCELCNGIVENKRNATGHKDLVVVKNSKADVIGHNVRYVFYKCENCGQDWRYEDDKDDNFAGWSKL